MLGIIFRDSFSKHWISGIRFSSWRESGNPNPNAIPMTDLLWDFNMSFDSLSVTAHSISARCRDEVLNLAPKPVCPALNVNTPGFIPSTVELVIRLRKFAMGHCVMDNPSRTFTLFATLFATTTFPETLCHTSTMSLGQFSLQVRIEV